MRLNRKISMGTAILLLTLATLSCNIMAPNRDIITPSPSASANEIATQQSETETPLGVGAIPTDTVPTETTLSAQDRLIGAWEVGDLENYIFKAIPEEMINQYQLSPKNTNGKLEYDFNADGTTRIISDQYKVEFGAKLGPLPVTLVVGVKGSSQATYLTDATKGQLTFKSPDMNDINVSATVAGTALLDSNQGARFATMVWFGATNSTPASVTYQCNGDLLTIQPDPTSGFPGDPIYLSRIAP